MSCLGFSSVWRPSSLGLASTIGLGTAVTVLRNASGSPNRGDMKVKGGPVETFYEGGERGRQGGEAGALK